VGDVLPSWFPHARYDRDRTGGAGLLSEFGVVPPTVRLITFHLSSGAATRANLASPAMRGPAVIRDLTFEHTGDASAATAISFSIFLAVSAAVNGTGLANAVIPPGVNIFELAYATSLGFARPSMDGFITLASAAKGYGPIPIGRVVTDSQFFLNFSLMVTGGTTSRNGVVRVYEHVDPQLVAGLVLA
jgi:hypothetical protein